VIEAAAGDSVDFARLKFGRFVQSRGPLERVRNVFLVGKAIRSSVTTKYSGSILRYYGARDLRSVNSILKIAPHGILATRVVATRAETESLEDAEQPDVVLSTE
jgi:hypothetical protein